jgi:heme/copper-type cytochrome/quinol oxidase subunit 4
MADEKDYHGKQNYVMLLGIIGVLVIVMVGVSMSLTGSAKVLTIGALAAVQFYMVLNNLMHLKYEPALVTLVAYLSVVFIVIFIFGAAPDTLMVDLDGSGHNGRVFLVAP